MTRTDWLSLTSTLLFCGGVYAIGRFTSPETLLLGCLLIGLAGGMLHSAYDQSQGRQG